MALNASYEREKWRKFRARRRAKVAGVIFLAFLVIVMFACITAAANPKKAVTSEDGAMTIETAIATPEPTATPAPIPHLATDEEVVMAAKTIWGEARGIKSVMEQAGIVWGLCGRADKFHMSIKEVIEMPNQVCYDPSFPTYDDYGRDLEALARDVIGRWEREHAGETDVGRVIPEGYLWWGGDGERNWFRNDYEFDKALIWDWSLENPYES